MTRIVLGDKHEKFFQAISLSNVTREETNCSNVIVKKIASTHIQAYKLFGKAVGHGLIKFGNLCSKISSGLWALTNVSRYLDSTIMKCVYYILIYPHLQYCASTWGQASVTALKPLKILQNKALQIITHTPQRISAKPLYSSLQMLKFKDTVKLQIAKSM